MQVNNYDSEIVDYYSLIQDKMTFQLLLEATVKSAIFKTLNKNRDYFNKIMQMDKNQYIEGAVFDTQKSPMKFYNGLTMADILGTKVDFENGGGIKNIVIG